MSKYTVTFSCGHTDDVSIYEYNHYSREQLEQMLCPECRDNQNKANAESNKKIGFAVLSGSPKQIGWAETIRSEKLKLFNDFFEQHDDLYEGEKLEAYLRFKENAINELMNETSAESIINMRHADAPYVHLKQGGHINLYSAVEGGMKYEPKSFEIVLAEPEEIKYEGFCKIAEENKFITVNFYREYEFTKIMYKHDFEWDERKKVWIRLGTSNSNTLADGICSVGHDLLSHGFRVEYPNSELMEKTLAGDFDPESSRYVTIFTRSFFSVNFKEDDKDKAEILQFLEPIMSSKPRSDYRKYKILISTKYFNEVSELGNKFDFYISDDLNEAISILKQRSE